MSIINEALKKAQKNPLSSSPSSIRGVELKTEFKEELLGKRARINWGPLFVIGVLLLIVGPILMPLMLAPLKVSSAPGASSGRASELSETAPPMVSVGSLVPQSVPAPPLTSPAMSPQFGIEEISTMPALMTGPLATKDLTLSGIVFSEKTSFCLINGKVLKVGESVSGATVVGISNDQVTLDVGGERVVLSTNDGSSL